MIGDKIMSIKNKTAIITGSGSGIGKQITLDLAKDGYNIVVASLINEQVTQTVQEAKQFGIKAMGFAKDLSDPFNISDLLNKTADEFGKIDILINCAAIIIPKWFTEETIEEFDRTMAINLRSMFILGQAVLNKMIEQKDGYIINISSTAAIVVPPTISSYGISKKGVLGLTEAMYEAGKKYNVKVSTILPGVTNTEMVRNLFPNDSPDQWMLPEDISYCVKFLLNQSKRMIVREIVPWAVGHDVI
jgi:NAD(P)-dependent dehydrogenase (short-subunit alcohol dehydrogenase family)